MTNESDREQDKLDQQLFDRWIAEDRFDDSADSHQPVLREQVLAAFDASRSDPVQLKSTWSARQVLSVAAVLAACVLAVVLISTNRGSRDRDGQIAELPAEDPLSDSLLAQMISQVHESMAPFAPFAPAALPEALAVCHQEYEAHRMTAESTQRLHWQYQHIENFASPVSDSQEG